MCRRKGELGAPSPALSGGTVEVFFNVRGYVRFSPPVLGKPTHQFNELFGGRSGLGLWQRRAQLRHDFIAHRDLHGRAGILVHLPDQFRQPLPRFADGELHGVKCTRVYKGSQQRMDLGCHAVIVKRSP